MNQKYATPDRNVSAKDRCSFIDYLKETLKAGDSIYAFMDCGGKDRPKIFDHWSNDQPRRADGSRIAINRIFFINNDLVICTPFLIVTENPGEEFFILSDETASDFATAAASRQ